MADPAVLRNRYAGHLVATLAAAIVSFVTNARAADLTGAGGMAIYPVLSEWAKQYAKDTGNTVTYQPIGSSAGIEQFQERTIMFANSDMPLVPENVAKYHLVQFPQLMVSIAPVVPSRASTQATWCSTVQPSPMCISQT